MRIRVRKPTVKKLLLDLLATGLLIATGWIGYQVFVLHQWNPVVGSIVFLIDIGILIWTISTLRNSYYRYKKPSFRSIFFSVFGILLVLTFAGVQPLAAYKDSVLATAGIVFLVLLILFPFIIWFVLYFVIGPVFRIKMR